MPFIDFYCKKCDRIEEDMFFQPAQMPPPDQLCPKCNEPMRKLYPSVVHAKVGAIFDNADRGKVIQEKNNKLKAMHAGYSYEHSSMRQKIEAQVQQKLEGN